MRQPDVRSLLKRLTIAGFGVLPLLLTACGANGIKNSIVPVFAVTNDYDPVADAQSIDALTPLPQTRSTNPRLNPLTDAAIAVSESDSTAARRVVETRLALNGLRWSALPELNLNASLRSTQSSDTGEELNDAEQAFRVGLQQKLIDFGEHASEARTANIELTRASVERWEEHNQSVHDALEQYVEIKRHRQLLALSTEHVSKHEELRTVIKNRFDGGVAELSEASLVDFRLQELSLQRDTDELQLLAAREELAYQTELTDAEIVQLVEQQISIIDATNTDTSAAPGLVHAELGVQTALAGRQRTRSQLLPSLVVEAFAETSDDVDQQGVELRFETSGFAGFAYRSRARSAEASIETARTEVAFSRRQLDRELQRLALEHNNLTRRQVALDEQRNQAEESQKLFAQQFKAGVKPVVDAVRVYQQSLDAARQLISVDADLSINTLTRALLLGRLAPFPRS